MPLFKGKIVKFIGNEAKEAIDNLIKSFPDYEVEYVIVDLQIKGTLISQVKGNLQVKMRKNREQNTEVIVEPQEPMKITKRK